MAMESTLVVIDDEEQIVKAIARLFARLHYQVVGFTSGTEAIEHCNNNHFDLVICDMRMPFVSGIDTLTALKKINPNCKTIMLSGYSDFDSVVTALNHRLLDQFVHKPWDNNQLIHMVDELLSEPKHKAPPEISEQAAITLTDTPNGLTSFCGMYSQSELMTNLWHNLTKVAAADLPVYIQGESGTGKELCAKAIHIQSERCELPFVAINCANSNEQLIESHLFGHVKGAFTGAESDKQGIFDTANKGTLFLDEVVELPLSTQAKLLRVIQEKEYMPVGSTQLKPLDVRVISASATHISDAVNSGQFREDLMYRLNVLPVQLPRLAHRAGDASKLFIYFFKLYKKDNSDVQLTPVLQQFLDSYSWPGNVRELINVAAYCCAMSTGNTLDVSDLPPQILPASTGLIQGNVVSINTPPTLKSLSKQELELLLAKYGSKAELANYLNVSRMTLWRYLKSLKLG